MHRQIWQSFFRLNIWPVISVYKPALATIVGAFGPLTDMLQFKFSAADDTLVTIQSIGELNWEETRFGQFVVPVGHESKLRDK